MGLHWLHFILRGRHIYIYTLKNQPCLKIAWPSAAAASPPAAAAAGRPPGRPGAAAPPPDVPRTPQGQRGGRNHRENPGDAGEKEGKPQENYRKVRTN